MAVAGSDMVFVVFAAASGVGSVIAVDVRFEMKCKQPVKVGDVYVGCNQCMHCRINRRREWVARLKLEAMSYDITWFATLTYAEEHLPAGGTLVPDHCTRWLKRLRKRLDNIYGEKLRYFLVGEYGDTTERPHYHAILYCHADADISEDVQETWPYGHTLTVPAEDRALTYVCGYTVKKMTHADDLRLNGRHPEFVRFSRRPGLGAANAVILAQIRESVYLRAREGNFRAPEIRAGGGRYPLPRALKRRVELATGTLSLSRAEANRSLEQTTLRYHAAAAAGGNSAADYIESLRRAGVRSDRALEQRTRKGPHRKSGI